MTDKQMINNFTEGPILKHMIPFAIPFMLSNAMQVAYAIVDMIIVGQFVGAEGLSAVSVASQVFTFMTMLCLGFATGGQVYISQLIGSGRKDKLNNTIGTLFSIVFMIGIVMSVIGLVFKTQILHLLNTPSESFHYALDYMVVCSLGILFTYGYNLLSAIFRGMGDSKHPFIFILIASLVNVVLDLFFICVLHLSVLGAALATILGQAVSFICALIYLYNHKTSFGFDFKLESFKIDTKIASALLKIGVPFAVQNAAINISMMFVNTLVNGLGVYASATFGVGLKLDDIINKISAGIMYAASSMVGQNVAAKKYDRTKSIVWYSIGLSSILYLCFGLLMFLKPKLLFGFFTSDIEVIKLAPIYVSAILWNYPAMVLMRGTNGLIQGCGNSKLSLVFSLLDAVVFRIGLSYLMGIVLNLGLYGFFLGYGLAAYGTSIPGMIYFLSNKWQSFELIQD